jgi:hypothetical protein
MQIKSIEVYIASKSNAMPKCLGYKFGYQPFQPEPQPNQFRTSSRKERHYSLSRFEALINESSGNPLRFVPGRLPERISLSS